MELQRLPGPGIAGPLLTCAETDDKGKCLRFLPTCDGADCLTESPPHPEVKGRKKRKKSLMSHKSRQAGKKAPWKMTSDEWAAAVEAVRPETVQTLPTKGSGAEAARNIAEHERLNYDAYIWNEAQRGGVVNHKLVIAKAFQEGRSIPKEVLVEYPDIGGFVRSSGYKRERGKILDIIEYRKKGKAHAQAEKRRLQIDMVYKTDIPGAIERVLALNPRQDYFIWKKSPQRTYVESKTPPRGKSYAKVTVHGLVLWYNAKHERVQEPPKALTMGLLSEAALAGDLLTCSRWIVVGKGADQLIRCGSYKQTCHPGDADCAGGKKPAAVKVEPATPAFGEFWFHIPKGGRRPQPIPETVKGQEFEDYLSAEKKDKGRTYRVFAFGWDAADAKLREALTKGAAHRKEWGGRPDRGRPPYTAMERNLGYRTPSLTNEEIAPWKEYTQGFSPALVYDRMMRTPGEARQEPPPGPPPEAEPVGKEMWTITEEEYLAPKLLKYPDAPEGQIVSWKEQYHTAITHAPQDADFPIHVIEALTHDQWLYVMKNHETARKTWDRLGPHNYWRMTYREALREQKIQGKITQIPTRTIHKAAVESALSEGLPVPPEVLAEYPKLAPADKLSGISLLTLASTIYRASSLL